METIVGTIEPNQKRRIGRPRKVVPVVPPVVAPTVDEKPVEETPVEEKKTVEPVAETPAKVITSPPAATPAPLPPPVVVVREKPEPKKPAGIPIMRRRG